MLLSRCYSPVSTCYHLSWPGRTDLCPCASFMPRSSGSITSPRFCPTQRHIFRPAPSLRSLAHTQPSSCQMPDAAAAGEIRGHKEGPLRDAKSLCFRAFLSLALSPSAAGLIQLSFFVPVTEPCLAKSEDIRSSHAVADTRRAGEILEGKRRPASINCARLCC